MISATDPTLGAALKTLRQNSELGPRIIDMETAGFAVNIKPGPAGKLSRTEHLGLLAYDVFINSRADDVLAIAKYGVRGTNEVNSIAHELGHVFFEYVFDFKKKPLTGPPEISLERLKEVLSETMARQWDNRTRPQGSKVRLRDTDGLDVPIPPGTFMDLIKSDLDPGPGLPPFWR